MVLRRFSLKTSSDRENPAAWRPYCRDDRGRRERCAGTTEADAGIAVAGATDAAKSAADIVLTRPGLSVIIDAIERSREIFRRMENYAVYRIAETVRVLIFLTLCIVLLNFYPVTALMLVVLAILNDLPIMMIAFDNAQVAGKPVRWQMNRILTLATILGILGVVSSFILLWVAREYFHLDAGVIQTLIFLKLAVTGHMTIYLARTGQQHFWERPLPAFALFGTQNLHRYARLSSRSTVFSS